MSDYSILDKASGARQAGDLDAASTLTSIQRDEIERLIAERGVCESIDHLVERPSPSQSMRSVFAATRAEAIAASRAAALADENGANTAEHHEEAGEAHQMASEAADTCGDLQAGEAHDHVARAHHAAALAGEAHGYDDGRAAVAAQKAPAALERGDVDGARVAADEADVAAKAAVARFRAA